MKKHPKLIFAVGIVFILVFVIVSCRNSRLAAAEARLLREQQVKSVVQVGMSEEDATQALRDAGIRFGPKVQPTVLKIFTINIPIVDSIGKSSALEYTVTGSTRFTGVKAYVIITLDEKGVVTAVE